MRKWGLLAGAMALCAAGQARANAFDDCVLNSMAGVTSDAAAKSIKEACLRKSSVPMNSEDMRGLRIVTGFYGTYGMNRTPAFTAEVKNDTGFIVTEITFSITVDGGQAELYRADDFRYFEPGVIYSGLPSDPTMTMRIDPLKGRKFQFPIDRPEIDKKKKWNWQIVGAKGIVSQ